MSKIFDESIDTKVIISIEKYNEIQAEMDRLEKAVKSIDKHATMMQMAIYDLGYLPEPDNRDNPTKYTLIPISEWKEKYPELTKSLKL